MDPMIQHEIESLCQAKVTALKARCHFVAQRGGSATEAQCRAARSCYAQSNELARTYRH